MEKLVKTQNIIFQSKNRQVGTTTNTQIDFAENMILCDDDELMSIKLSSFSLYSNQYLINDTNNSFTLVKVSDISYTNFVLPSGTYPYKTLADTINLLAGGKICTYNRVQNKLYFTFTEPYTLIFNDLSYAILGFDNASYTGTSISSVYVLNPTVNIQNLCIHLKNLTPYKVYNIDNTKGYTTISDCLMVIPYRIEPFDTFYYENTGNQYVMFFNEKKIQELEIIITDMDGNEIVNLPDWTMTFQIDTHIDNDEQTIITLLTNIFEYTKLNFLSNYTK